MPCLREAYPPDCARAETGGLTMDEYIERETAVKAANEWVSEACMAPVMRVSRLFDKLQKVPAADVAPIEALERLRDEMCAQDLITMEGLRRLNTLIWKYTTVHDGGAE